MEAGRLRGQIVRQTHYEHVHALTADAHSEERGWVVPLATKLGDEVRVLGDTHHFLLGWNDAGPGARLMSRLPVGETTVPQHGSRPTRFSDPPVCREDGLRLRAARGTRQVSIYSPETIGKRPKMTPCNMDQQVAQALEITRESAKCPESEALEK